VEEEEEEEEQPMNLGDEGIYTPGFDPQVLLLESSNIKLSRRAKLPQPAPSNLAIAILFQMQEALSREGTGVYPHTGLD
jgi:hypothetical protein